MLSLLRALGRYFVVRPAKHVWSWFFPKPEPWERELLAIMPENHHYRTPDRTNPPLRLRPAAYVPLDRRLLSPRFAGPREAHDGSTTCEPRPSSDSYFGSGESPPSEGRSRPPDSILL